jgi:hypothetical protein
VKVGYFSPLPPARTGVADYAATLLAALKRLGEVEPDARNADVNLYQMGNNQLHRDIYAKALAEPGGSVVDPARCIRCGRRVFPVSDAAANCRSVARDCRA